MAESLQSTITHQVLRVRRRLWLGTFVRAVLLCWSGAFALATGYFLIRNAIWGPGSEFESTIILASAGVLGLFAGIGWALWKSPGNIASALALDEQFGLKERVTTFLTMSPEQANSAAGAALLEDVHQRVAKLDVRSKFAIHASWLQGIMPACAATLAVLALLFCPQIHFTGSSRGNGQSQLAPDLKEAQLQLDNLKKVALQRNDDKPLSKEAKEIEDEWRKLLDKEIDGKSDSQVRETIEAMRTLEEKMKERVKELKELGQKGKDLKKALDQLDKLGKKLNPDGPGKDFQDALAKGNLKKAAEELDKLRKKIDNNEMSKAEQDKLFDQLKNLKESVDRLKDQQDERDQLKKDFDDGKIDQNELDREMDRLNQEMADMQDLQDLAELLDDLGKSQGGNGGDLQGKLARLKGKLKALELDEDELKRLLDEQEKLEEARLAILAQCQGNCDKQGNMSGLGQGKHPGTKRPYGPEPKDSKISDQRQQAETDPRGKMRIAGFGKGGTFTKIEAKNVAGALQQVDQKSSEVIDPQRIPADAADIAKGYFQKLGGQGK